MQHTIEVVIFPVKPGVTSAQLLTASAAITPILSAMPGFISRDFGAGDDGQFLDIIHWRDRDAAHFAAQQVMGHAQCCAYFDLMDQARMQFSYFNHAFFANV